MRAKTTISAVLLALSGAAIAQVTTTPEAKPGADRATENLQSANAAATVDNAADNVADPGKS